MTRVGRTFPEALRTIFQMISVLTYWFTGSHYWNNRVIDWNLPPAPTKTGDSRSANWDGLGQVELDAVTPEKLIELCEDAISEFFDEDLYSELLEQQSEEREEYRTALRNFVNNLRE